MLKTRVLIVSAMFAGMLSLCSCGSSNTVNVPEPSKAAPAKPPRVNQPQAPSGVPTYRDQSNAAPANQASPDIPAPPAGAQYTIFAARIEGPIHVEQATRMRDELRAKSGMKDWYVIHQDSQSLLYYGYYRTIPTNQNSTAADVKEAARAKAERERVDAMKDQSGNRPFNMAMFMELEAPDPAAPPEWNLANAPGESTLQIAVYKDSPERKQAAVDAVRAARAQGVEAYYYHGEAQSSVCIGHWPAGAYRTVDAVPPRVGPDAGKPYMVVPVTGDAETDKHFEDVARERNMPLLRPHVEIVDPTLRAAMEAYPNNAVNGAWIKHVVGGKETFDPSQLVLIPRERAVAARTPAPNQYTPAYPAIPSQVERTPQPQPQQPQQPQPGVGRLRSIGG